MSTAIAITTFIIGCLSILASWIFFRKENYWLAILLLILGGLGLRIVMSMDPFLHPWDERYHALVAKNLIQNPLIPTLYSNPVLPYDYTSWLTNHIWLHKQPVPLWLMAGSMKLFGTNLIALRLPSLLLSTTGIYLVYRIGKHIWNLQTGFIAAFLFAIHGLILELGSGRVPTDHIDIQFMSFILLAVFFGTIYTSKRNIIFLILGGVSIGLAILCKWLPAIIVLPVWSLISYSTGKFSIKRLRIDTLILILVAGTVVLPWHLYMNEHFPLEYSWEMLHNSRHLTEALDGQGGPFYFHFDKMRIIYGELIYIPLIWMIYHTFKRKNDWKLWSLFIWIIIPYVFFSLAKTKMQGYTLLAAPALFLLTALFWGEVKSSVGRMRNKWLLYLLLIGLLALPVRYSIERMKPFGIPKANEVPDWQANIESLHNMIKDPDRTIIFNVDHSIETMFHTGAVVYQFQPTDKVIDSLLQEGYILYNNISGKIKPDNRMIEVQID